MRAKDTHEWNEKITFIGTFPSLSQTFIVDVVVSDCCYKRVLASMELPFEMISMEVDGICKKR